MASGVYGYSHTTGGYDGGQAEYVRVPFADVGPMKIPDDMSEEEVLFLSDILPTGYQAAEMGEIKGGETVVVLGCGPVGLFAMKSAWLLGAGRVIAVDHVDYRLDFARRYAGVETLNFKQVPDLVAHLKDQFEGRGPDVVIEAVGMEAEGCGSSARWARPSCRRACRWRSTGPSRPSARAATSPSSASTVRPGTWWTSAPR